MSGRCCARAGVPSESARAAAKSVRASGVRRDAMLCESFSRWCFGRASELYVAHARASTISFDAVMFFEIIPLRPLRLLQRPLRLSIDSLTAKDAKKAQRTQSKKRKKSFLLCVLCAFF